MGAAVTGVQHPTMEKTLTEYEATTDDGKWSDDNKSSWNSDVDEGHTTSKKVEEDDAIVVGAVNDASQQDLEV